MNIDQALQYGKQGLSGSESPEIDSQYLLCYVLDCAHHYLHTWSDQTLTTQQQQQFEQLVSERKQGKPIAHLIGQRGFWTLDLKVTADTLIPRPETELLVTLALEKITSQMRIADLGTGTGAIALSIAKEHPETVIFATDYSQAALDVAHYNAQHYALHNVHFWQGSWLDAVATHSLDMIISNPPYIEQNDPHLQQGDVRFEPITALSSGSDGLDDIRQIVRQAAKCLNPAGYLLIEHGYNQAEQIMQLFQGAGFMNIKSEQDLGGKNRVVMGVKA